MPIPNDPALVQIALHWQTVHLDAGGLAASDGLTFSIL